MNDNNTDDVIVRLERNLRTAARVVYRYGETYLPVFKRVDREYQKAQAENDVIAKIRSLAA